MDKQIIERCKKCGKHLTERLNDGLYVHEFVTPPLAHKCQKINPYWERRIADLYK